MVMLAVPAAAGPVPDGLPHPNDLMTVYPVTWQGEQWLGRQSPLARQRPNDNYWLATPQTIWTDDQGRLHLKATQLGGRWFAVGLNSVKNDYSYGTYQFVVDTPMDALDPMAVVGMFTYNRDVVPSRQESDVELSRWGQPSPVARNAQWVVQPWTRRGHLLPFTVPPTQSMTYTIRWKPNSVTFTARQGDTGTGTVVNRWRSTKALPGTAQAGTEVHLNLWFLRGEAPYDRQPQEVVFRSFTYTPRDTA